MKHAYGILVPQILPMISWAMDLDDLGKWHVVLLRQTFDEEWTWQPMCSCACDWECEGSAPEAEWWGIGDREECGNDEFHSDLLQDAA